MKKVAAVINARLTSTRCPRKLIRPFGGSTLIQIALEKLNEMDFFDFRYLAAAEEELIHLALPFSRVEVIKRKLESISPGFNKDLKVIYEHYLSMPCDYIFLINPCQPLLIINSVRRAYDAVISSEYNSYTSVSSFRDWVFNDRGECVTGRNVDTPSTGHRQEYLKMSHSFHVFNRDYFVQTGRLWRMKKSDPFLIKVEKKETYDVDTQEDFEVTQKMYQLVHSKEKCV